MMLRCVGRSIISGHIGIGARYSANLTYPLSSFLVTQSKPNAGALSLQQIRKRSANRHVTSGYSVDLDEDCDSLAEYSRLERLADLDRYPQYLESKEYYEKPTRKRYFLERTGKRQRKIREVKSLVKLMHWRREQGYLGARSEKWRKSETVKSIFPLQGPEGY